MGYLGTKRHVIIGKSMGVTFLCGIFLKSSICVFQHHILFQMFLALARVNRVIVINKTKSSNPATAEEQCSAYMKILMELPEEESGSFFERMARADIDEAKIIEHLKKNV